MSNGITYFVFYSKVLKLRKGKNMLFLLVRWIFFAFALLFVSAVVPGISIAGFAAALWATLVIGLVNIFIKPVLILLTLPINLLTLGLFTFVINALMLLLVAKLVEGFVVMDFWAALWGSILLSILSLFINRLYF